MEIINDIFDSLVKAPMILIFVLLLGLYIFRSVLPLRNRGSGYKYVYVEDDATVRELDGEERIYLNTKFHGADGARPYIKHFFWSKTPDKKIGGYIRRTKVPWWKEIKKNYTKQRI